MGGMFVLPLAGDISNYFTNYLSPNGVDVVFDVFRPVNESELPSLVGFADC